MSRLHGRGFARLDSNITPLIDMSFLLIVFFALVSNLVGVDAVRMSLPRPSPSMAMRPGQEPRTVVNAVPGPDGTLEAFVVGGRRFEPTREGLGMLAELLAQALRDNPATDINLRADRSIHWRHLAPVVESVSRAAGVSTPGRPARLKLVVAAEGSADE